MPTDRNAKTAKSATGTTGTTDMGTSASAVVFKCQWPGPCPNDAATRIGTLLFPMFYACPTHAEVWRASHWVKMRDIHAQLAGARPRTVANRSIFGIPGDERPDYGVAGATTPARHPPR
jgi:hypothetical protein